MWSDGGSCIYQCSSQERNTLKNILQTLCLQSCLLHWTALKVLVAQSCLTLCNPMGSNPSFSSVHGILQRILEWIAIPFSRGSSQPRNQTQVSCIAGRFFTIWATRVGPLTYSFIECILLEKHCCQGLTFNPHYNSEISTIICFTEEETDAERWSFWFKAIQSKSPGAGFWIHTLDSKIGGSTTLQTASDTSWMRKGNGDRGVVVTWNQEGTWEGHVQ